MRAYSKKKQASHFKNVQNTRRAVQPPSLPPEDAKGETKSFTTRRLFLYPLSLHNKGLTDECGIFVHGHQKERRKRQTECNKLNERMIIKDPQHNLQLLFVNQLHGLSHSLMIPRPQRNQQTLLRPTSVRRTSRSQSSRIIPTFKDFDFPSHLILIYIVFQYCSFFSGIINIYYLYMLHTTFQT